MEPCFKVLLERFIVFIVCKINNYLSGYKMKSFMLHVKYIFYEGNTNVANYHKIQTTHF